MNKLQFKLKINFIPIIIKNKGKINLNIKENLIRSLLDKNSNIPSIRNNILLNFILSSNISIIHGIMINNVHHPLKNILKFIIFKDPSNASTPNAIKIKPKKRLVLFFFILLNKR